MTELPLEPIPNQSFSVKLADDLYNITVKEANGIMAATIIRNNVTLISGIRLLANGQLLPYKYQEKGNFILLTQNDNIPYYAEFGISQFLLYASVSELELIRAGIGS